MAEKMDKMIGGMTSDSNGQLTTGGRSKNEGELTSQIEQQTARMPSLTFLSLAGAAVVGSMALLLSARKTGPAEWANFVSSFVPTLLILGLYNKLVKEHEGTAYSRRTGFMESGH